MATAPDQAAQEVKWKFSMYSSLISKNTNLATTRLLLCEQQTLCIERD